MKMIGYFGLVFIDVIYVFDELMVGLYLYDI